MGVRSTFNTLVESYWIILFFFLMYLKGRRRTENRSGEEEEEKDQVGGKKKKRAHDKYEKNIAMADCLQAGHNITRQPVIAIFFLYLWCARLIFPPAVRA